MEEPTEGTSQQAASAGHVEQLPALQDLAENPRDDSSFWDSAGRHSSEAEHN